MCFVLSFTFDLWTINLPAIPIRISRGRFIDVGVTWLFAKFSSKKHITILASFLGSINLSSRLYVQFLTRNPMLRSKKANSSAQIPKIKQHKRIQTIELLVLRKVNSHYEINLNTNKTHFPSPGNPPPHPKGSGHSPWHRRADCAQAIIAEELCHISDLFFFFPQLGLRSANWSQKSRKKSTNINFLSIWCCLG